VAGFLSSGAQDAAVQNPPAPVPAVQDPVVQEFSGSGSTTTGLFKVPDRWEVRWNARQAVSIAVMAADGTIVAGEAGVLRGSIFLPSGGQFYLKISEGIVPSADAAPTPAAPPTATTNTAPTNAAPTAATAPTTTTNVPPANASPSQAAPATATTNAPPAEPTPVTWHLQVVELGASVASSQKLTVYEPFFVPPDSAINPVHVAPALPPPKLTEEQSQAEVIIKGDNAQGAGFLLHTAEGHFVVTNLHLLSANPNIQILTSSGAPITTISLKGSVNRDIAMFAIQDANYSYLSLSADDASAAQEGDALVIPGIIQGVDGVISIPGKLVAMGPDEIEFNNALNSGSSGAPVIHAKSGKVLAVVTPAKKLDLTDALAKAWAANSPPGSSAIIPFLGQRLAGAKNWETYDWQKFLGETLFLKQVHEETRCLDSFLHGRRRRGWGPNADDGPPDNRYFLNNPELSSANDTYKQMANGADSGQRVFATRELLSSLQTVADSDLATLQDMNDFYAYNQSRAKEEIAYRVAIKKELDDLQGNLGRLDGIARGH